MHEDGRTWVLLGAAALAAAPVAARAVSGSAMRVGPDLAESARHARGRQLLRIDHALRAILSDPSVWADFEGRHHLWLDELVDDPRIRRLTSVAALTDVDRRVLREWGLGRVDDSFGTEFQVLRQSVGRVPTGPLSNIESAARALEERALEAAGRSPYALARGARVRFRAATSHDRDFFHRRDSWAGRTGTVQGRAVHEGSHFYFGGVAELGEPSYLVARTPRGGALWFRESDLTPLRTRRKAAS